MLRHLTIYYDYYSCYFSSTETLLEITSDADKPSDNHRVIWCPYIPDEQGSGDEGDDPAFLLVLTHGPKVGCSRYDDSVITNHKKNSLACIVSVKCVTRRIFRFISFYWVVLLYIKNF